MASDQFAGLLETIRSETSQSALSRALVDAARLAHFPEQDIVPLVEELTPEQRQVAEAIATRSNVQDISLLNVPSMVQDRRRWLGIDKSGVLEDRITYRVGSQEMRWPRWRILRELDTSGRSSKFASAFKTKLDFLTACVQIWMSQSYGITRPEALLELIGEVGVEAAPWARELLKEIAAWPAPASATDPGHASFERPLLLQPVLLALLLPIARAGDKITPEYEPFVPFAPHHYMIEIAAALPPERREPLLVALAKRHDNKKEMLFTIFTLWPMFPLKGLGALANAFLADKASSARFGAGTIRSWSEAWLKVSKTHAAPAAKKSAPTFAPPKKRPEKVKKHRY